MDSGSAAPASVDWVLTIATANFACNGENGVKTEWRSLLKALVGIIGWVKEGDK